MNVIRALADGVTVAVVAVLITLALLVFVVAYTQPRRARHAARRTPFVEPTGGNSGGNVTAAGPDRIDAGKRCTIYCGDDVCKEYGCMNPQAVDLSSIRADDAWLDDPQRPPGRDPELEAVVAAWAATCQLGTGPIRKVQR